MKYLYLILLPLFFSACQSSSEKSTQQETTVLISEKLTVEDFEKKIESLEKEGKAFTIVDVRTPEEIAAYGKIENAININFNATSFESEIEKLDKSVPILMYCMKGGRSGKGCAALHDKDFLEVYDLEGGFTAWENLQKPIVK